MTRPLNIFALIIILLSCLTFLTLHVYAHNYVQEACSVTRYQDICLKTLASYSNKVGRSPKRWARVAVSVTIGEVKMVVEYLNKLKRNRHVVSSRRNRAALLDCVENVQDSLDNLHKSLDVLRRLSYEGFEEEMNDVLTWLSAALTDQDTCIDGFAIKRGKEIDRLCSKVEQTSFVTSNALALANKLAINGIQDFEGHP